MARQHGLLQQVGQRIAEPQTGAPLKGASTKMFDSATNLAPPVIWNAVTNTPVLSNGLWRVALPPDADSQQFYRLQTP